MAPKRAMPEPTWKLEAAPVEEAESEEEALVPWKPASSVEVPVAELREEEVVAVRVAWLIVVLRDMETPVPEALAAVPTGVTGAAVVVVLLERLLVIVAISRRVQFTYLALGLGLAEADALSLELAPWTVKGPK